MSNTTIILCYSESLISKAIRWQTRSAYSHALVAFPDGSGVESREGKGVRFAKDWRSLLGPKDRFDAFKPAHSPEQGRSVYNFLISQVGKKYDWTMVLRFLSRRQANRAQSDKWFCSELVFAAYQQAGVELLRDTQPWEVSPGLLSRSPLLTPVYEEVPDSLFPAS